MPIGLRSRQNLLGCRQPGSPATTFRLHGGTALPQAEDDQQHERQVHDGRHCGTTGMSPYGRFVIVAAPIPKVRVVRVSRCRADRSGHERHSIALTDTTQNRRDAQVRPGRHSPVAIRLHV
jgi:hypothetical protein